MNKYNPLNDLDQITNDNDELDESNSKSSSTCSSQTSFHSSLGLTSDDENDEIRSVKSHCQESILIEKDWKCNVPIKSCSHSVDFEKIPFAKGNFRYTFQGHWCNRCKRLDDEDHDNQKHGQLCVVKKWKREHVYDGTFWDRDIRVAQLASKLANKWNKKFDPLRRIRVLTPIKHVCVYQYRSLKKEENEKQKQTVKTACPKDGVALNERLMVEDYLDGNFVKWNSNSGWVKHESSVIQAFCHWTYHYSNTRILLCDAQGIYIYTTYIVSTTTIFQFLFYIILFCLLTFFCPSCIVIMYYKILSLIFVND